MYLIIFIILLFVLFINYTENYGQFPTYSYVYNKNYLECCNKFGCSHWSCRNILLNDLSRHPLLRVGYLQLVDYNKKHSNVVPYYRSRGSLDTTNVIPLYKKKNPLNKNVDDFYYVEPSGKYYSRFVKISTDHNLAEDEIIKINDNKYIVSYLGENDMYNSFVPLWPELITDHNLSSVSQVNYDYPKTIDGFYYIGRLINKHHFNGKPLDRWFEAGYFLYGLPLEDGLKYKYIIVQRWGNKYRTIWTFIRNKYEIGDFIHLKKANRVYGPYFLVA